VAFGQLQWAKRFIDYLAGLYVYNFCNMLSSHLLPHQFGGGLGVVAK
jgi:hypothetical protein